MRDLYTEGVEALLVLQVLSTLWMFEMCNYRKKPTYWNFLKPVLKTIP